MKFSRSIRRLIARQLPGRKRFCILCDRPLAYFLPYQRSSRPGLMAALDVIGSDLNNFECPHCGAHDRERHLFLYFDALRLFEYLNDRNILHVAPENQLSKRIAAAKPAQYIRCDLYPSGPDIVRVDVLNMQFPSASFDLVIANHILEHVSDDMLALAEILRVLKPGGCAILQTPYSRKLLHTWSDPGIDDDAGRLQAYGQEDHVRLYGSDVFTRLASCGLVADIRSHAQLLSHLDPESLGVNSREPLFLFHRGESVQTEIPGSPASLNAILMYKT